MTALATTFDLIGLAVAISATLLCLIFLTELRVCWRLQKDRRDIAAMREDVRRLQAQCREIATQQLALERAYFRGRIGVVAGTSEREF